MSMYIPRPARDIIINPLSIISMKKNADKFENGSAQMAVLGIAGGGFFILPVAEKTIKAISRTALSAIGIFTIYQMNASIEKVAIAATFVSLPSVLIAGGSVLAYQGINQVASSIFSGSLETFGYGACSLIAGWTALEYHDFAPLGIIEGGIESSAKFLAPYLVKRLI